MGDPDDEAQDLAHLLMLARERFRLELLLVADDGRTVGSRDEDVIRVPLRGTDGEVFGTLCGLAPHRGHRFGQREVDELAPFADLMVAVIRNTREGWTQQVESHAALARLTVAGGPTVSFQPAFNLTTGVLSGYEALARFPFDAPEPSDWFQAADLVGQLVQLELDAIRVALTHLDHLHGRVSLNASEATLLDPALLELLEPAPAERLVIEITEQHAIKDYSRVGEVIADLRSRGTMLAIDDVGSGFSSLRHVLALDPEIIKLDIGLVRDIDSNTRQQVLVSSLNDFARRTDTYLVAEGIETGAELGTLIDLGIQHGQGFHLGRPALCPAH